MGLANLIIESKTIESEYPGKDGMVIKLAHLTREELKRIRKKATTQKFSRVTKQPEEEVDNDLFQDLWVKSVLLGWSGFKYKYLESMIPIDTSAVSAEVYKEGEGLLPYSGGCFRTY